VRTIVSIVNICFTIVMASWGTISMQLLAVIPLSEKKGYRLNLYNLLYANRVE